MTGPHLVLGGMPMPTFDQILSRVVERKGFAIRGADQAGLLAHKGDESLLVAWKTDSAVTTSDALLFITAMAQIHATSGILVAARGTEPAARDQLAPHKNVEVWAESRLVVEVGEAFVKDALDGAAGNPAPLPTAAVPAHAAAPVQSQAQAVKQTSRFPSLVAQAVSLSASDTRGAAYLMPSRPREPTPQAAATAGGAPLRYAWGGISGSEVDPGVAQVRNGRRPRAAAEPATIAHDDVEIVSTPRRARAAPAPEAPAPATPVMVPDDDDVELMVTPRRGGAASATAAPAAPAPAPAPAPAKAPAPVPASTDAYEVIVSKPRRAASTPEADAQSAGGVTPAAAGDALRAVFAREEAEARAAPRAGAVKATKLALVPHIAFEYDARVERAALPVPMQGKGAILVSSLTGELRAVDRLDFADALPQDARRDAPKLQAVDIYDRVKGHLLKQFTKEVKVERELGGNTVMENQRIVPAIEELGLQHRGVVYAPVWEISGATGSARVDGLSGHLL